MLLFVCWLLAFIVTSRMQHGTVRTQRFHSNVSCRTFFKELLINVKNSHLYQLTELDHISISSEICQTNSVQWSHHEVVQE